MKRFHALAMAAALAAVLAGCVQQSAVKDFGEATAVVGAGYGELFAGGEDVCRMQLEADWVRKEKAPGLYPLEAMAKECGAYGEAGKAYLATANALAAYGAALTMLAGKADADYSDRITPINENLGKLLGNRLPDAKEKVAKANGFVSKLITFFINRYVEYEARKFILESEADVLNVFELLGGLNALYQEQAEQLGLSLTKLSALMVKNNMNSPQYIDFLRRYDEALGKRLALIAAFDASLGKVRSAHAKLADQARAGLDLSDKDFVASMKKTASEIRAIYNEAKSLF